MRGWIFQIESKYFAGFERGTHELVAAPRLLDEGIDVPAADLAIVLASSRSKRQMIQRMGRVVRRKNDGRLARLAILYVEGTTEDPEAGAYEDFVEAILDVADSFKVFRAADGCSSVLRYLNDFLEPTELAPQQRSAAGNIAQF